MTSTNSPEFQKLFDNCSFTQNIQELLLHFLTSRRFQRLEEEERLLWSKHIRQLMQRV